MKNTGPLGVGIRGAGQVAIQHAAAVEKNPNLYLAAVCSRSLESAEEFVTRYAPKAAVYRGYEDMLNDPGVDIVSICMPNYLHAREAILAMKAGKHLILEKPPAMTWEEIEALETAARGSGVKSVVSFVLRWHPLVINIRNLLDKNAIGDIYYTEMDYWHGIKPSFSSYNWIRKMEFAGGAMITGGSHAVDLARYLKGEISEVFAYSCSQRKDFDYPTSYVAAVKFADDTIGKLSVSLDGLAFPYQFNIDLLGSAGAIRDNAVFSKELFPSQREFVRLSCDTPDSGSVDHHPFGMEIDNLVDCILSGTPVLSDVADACRSMAVVLAVTESAASGRPVSIPVP